MLARYAHSPSWWPMFSVGDTAVQPRRATCSSLARTTVHTVRVYTCEPVLSRSHTPILVLGVEMTRLNLSSKYTEGSTVSKLALHGAFRAQSGATP
eukprot:2748618-Prymnesium_polylepis.1